MARALWRIIYTGTLGFRQGGVGGWRCMSIQAGVHAAWAREQLDERTVAARSGEF